MPSSTQFKGKFGYFATASILLAAVWLAWLSSGAGDYFAGLAAKEARRGSAGQSTTAAIYHYQLASVLSLNKPQYISKLADLYLQVGRGDLAIRALRRDQTVDHQARIAQIYFDSAKFDLALREIEDAIRQKQTSGLLLLKTRILLELNRGGEATESAQQAGSYRLDDADNQLWLGLCLAADGKGDALKSLMATVSSPEALQTLRQASISNLHLARILYARGLLNTSGRTLDKYPDQNAEVAILKSEIALAGRPVTQQALAKAAESLKQGIMWDPGNIGLRKRLRAVYQEQGNADGVNTQSQFILQLEPGKI